MIIGNDSHQYQVIEDWAQLPDGVEFGTTHGVVEDAAGRIYIHSTGPKSVIILDPDGTYVDGWGGEYSEGAHGLHLSPENGSEFLYLAATGQHFVAKTTLDGDEVYRIEQPPRDDIYDDDHPFVPTEATVASNGDVYIADGYGEYWVHRYSPDAEYIDSFGGIGMADGKLFNPHGIMMDTRGDEELVLVSDRKNERLQYFTLEGQHVRHVRRKLRYPCTTVRWQDEIYVPDLRSRVSILDRDDNVIVHLGDWPVCWEREEWPNLPRSEWQTGKFSSPHDLHVDGDGNIFVVEWLPEIGGKVTKLARV